MPNLAHNVIRSNVDGITIMSIKITELTSIIVFMVVVDLEFVVDIITKVIQTSIVVEYYAKIVEAIWFIIIITAIAIAK